MIRVGLFGRLPWSWGLRPLHTEIFGQKVNEEPFDPRGHGVRRRGTVVHVLNFLYERRVRGLTRVMTVTTTDKVTSTIVNSKYFPIRGMTSDVDGIISTKKEGT